MTSPRDELRRAIRHLMFERWDPIGIRDIPEAADEYDAYVWDVEQMVLDKRTEREIFDYLWALETDHMGLVGDERATMVFACELAKLSQEASH